MTTRSDRRRSRSGRLTDGGLARTAVPADARRTRQLAEASVRLARSVERVRDAEASGDPKAIEAATKQRDRAARRLAGGDGDSRTLIRGAALLDVERSAHATLTAAGRTRAREVGAHALSIIASEGITAPLDLLAVSVGARLLGLALADVEERGIAALKGSTYASDRALSIIERAVSRSREDAEARADAGPTYDQAAAMDRLREHQARRLANAAPPETVTATASKIDLTGTEGADPEPTIASQTAPAVAHAPSGHPIDETPARPGVVARRPNINAEIEEH
jgi:hypothetical protein